MIMGIKQKKIPYCTKAKIETQKLHVLFPIIFVRAVSVKCYLGKHIIHLKGQYHEIF